MVQLRVISLGWGVQSWTLAAMAALGELQADVAIHADTFWEKAATYEFVRQWQPWLEAKGLRVVTVSDRRRAVDQMLTSGPDMPLFTATWNSRGQQPRVCTDRWKIQPVRRWYRSELMRLKIAKTPGAVTQFLGISLDEWHRMRDSDVKWIVNRYPLVDLRMTRGDCMTWLAAHDLPVPPKSACVFCPFQSRSAWQDLKRAGDDDWNIALEVDTAIRDVRPPFQLFVHPARVPLADAVQIPEDHGYAQPSMFDDDAGCDSGYCFV